MGSPIDVPAVVITEGEAIDIQELLTRARLALLNKEYDPAVRDYRLVAEAAIDPEQRLLGLVGWGTALDLGGKVDKALEIYQRAARESAPGSARSGLEVRIVRLLTYLERYQEAGKLAETLDLSLRPPLEQIALNAAVALFALSQSRVSDAERKVGDGRAIIFEHAYDTVAVPPLDVASLYFAQGEIHRLHAEEIRFQPLPVDFLGQLETRCQLILDAQGAYSDAMRSEDAHWSSMAGVQVGQLYQDLHRDLMDIPLPAYANTPERKQLFEGALRLRYSVLLRKSLSMMRATVALLERNQQPSPWREKAHQALLEIEAAQKREEEVIDSLPYSREQLKAALALLEQKAQAQGQGHK